MGGSYAPPSTGSATLTMPIPLLQVNGLPSGFNPSAASNVTSADHPGDLSQVVWNSSPNPSSTARSLYVHGASEYGPRMTIGHNSVNGGFIDTYGVFSLKLNGLDYLSADSFNQWINLSVSGTPALRLYPGGGAFFGNTPIDPGFGNVQASETLIAKNIQLNHPLGSVIEGVGGGEVVIANDNHYAIVVNALGHTNITQALQVKGGTHLVEMIAKEVVLSNPFGSSDFVIAAGDSVEFTILTDGNYTKGAVTATWKGASPSIGELRLHARVSGTAQVTLRVTNEASTAIALSGSASFPVTICILGFDYALGSGY